MDGFHSHAKVGTASNTHTYVAVDTQIPGGWKLWEILFLYSVALYVIRSSPIYYKNAGKRHISHDNIRQINTWNVTLKHSVGVGL